MPLPAFDELPLIEPLGLRHAWEVLDPELGTLALAGPAAVREAAGLVRDGVTVGLNLPVTEPDPPLYGRQAVRHEIFAIDRNTLDDRVDAFYPQASSQWDGLRHVRAREHGYFGGVTEDFAPGAGRLGIEHWARRGIAGRGVLLDVAAHRERAGRPLDPLAGEPIDPEDLADTAAAQGVELRQGDLLCVRTGWIEAYRGLDDDARLALSKAPLTSGLRGSEAMARFLWDAHVAAVCADNPSVERAPGDPADGSLHRRLIPALGMALAELLELGPLAALCAADGRWDFLFVAAPMHLPGAVGSPANAVAIR